MIQPNGAFPPPGRGVRDARAVRPCGRDRVDSVPYHKALRVKTIDYGLSTGPISSDWG
jgi:hypothetical protein